MAVQETARAGLGLLLAVPKNINSIIWNRIIYSNLKIELGKNNLYFNKIEFIIS